MPEEVLAEIVGNVTSVLVRRGEAVTPETDLVILESMKMEIPVRSERTGTLVDIVVKAGDLVQEGDVIALVEH
ncbi:biotin/lipoyl-binding carrier protein [Lentzea tibetensis]|uniref:Biotin/lipoyl-binding carrier protein n=1 Tax=Lentzea tibetensis TaxID=2591470 RepID=A0A563EIY5_9PSEU|nr:biotin/lipoyl-binding carrier protein [Lentzea tibetensis]TWP46677.1 biotin/lipoyl-binding carrier protein [Lentzea tibetensis]